MSADRFAVTDVVNRYGTALDAKDWDLLDQVFAPDVEAEYAGHYAGVEAIKGLVRSMLGGCGPTQHMLGNHRVEIDGDTATCISTIRAHHIGQEDQAHLTYECFGEYRDELRRFAEGWRITRRRMVVTHEVGSRDILRPPQR